MATKDYRVQVYTPGSTSLSTGNIDFTLDASRLAAPLTVRRPRVLPLSGRTETQPWNVQVADIGSTFTAQIADSSGRVDLLSRLVRAQVNRDGAGWTNLGVGRISNVELGADVASYTLTVEDERRLERTATIFSSNTTRLYPAGPHHKYGPFDPPEKSRTGPIWRASSRQVYVTFQHDAHPMSDETIAAIEADVRPDAFVELLSTRPSFYNLKCRIGDTDYDVQGFATIDSTAIGAHRLPTNITEGLEQHAQLGAPIRCVIVATSSEIPSITSSTQFAGGTSTSLSAFEQSSAFLHMFGAPASRGTPLHIDTIRVPDLIANVYNGDFSSSGTLLPRYSTAAIDTLKDADRGFRVRFRITDPSDMASWLEDHVYGPYGILPFIDSSGSITPTDTWLPNSTGVIGFTFTGSNLREPHPTWHNPSREFVTAIRFAYTHETPAIPRRRLVEGGFDPPLEPTFTPGQGPFVGGTNLPREVSPDRITAATATIERTHDRLAQLGRRTVTYQCDGLHTFDSKTNTYIPNPYSNEILDRATLEAASLRITQETFDRFGDGPQIGRMAGLSTCEGVEPGDWVALNLETFPDAQSLARGGTRWVQVMERGDEPSGPFFSYLDAGPNIQPLSAPGLTLSTSTGINPKHSVVATISSLGGGAKFQLQLARSTSTSAPSSGSSAWTDAPIPRNIVPDSSGDYTIHRLASNTRFFGRVRASRAMRLRSTWNVSNSAVTQAVSSHTSIIALDRSLAPNTSNEVQAMQWANGSTQYPVELLLDDSTGTTLSTANSVVRLPPVSQFYDIQGISSAVTTYLVGVRHFDQFGGFSDTLTTTFAPSTFGNNTATALRGLTILSAGT